MRPVIRSPVQMHDGQNDNLGLKFDIDEAVRKPAYTNPH
jgi:hypothetical protein